MQTNTITRQILCTTRPTDPRDRVDLWKYRKRQARIEQSLDKAFPQRHPEPGFLSPPCPGVRFFQRVLEMNSPASHMTLEQAVEHAAEHLPPGAMLHINIEKDSGWVEACDWDGNWREFDSADMPLAAQVTDCVQWLIEQDQNHA